MTSSCAAITGRVVSCTVRLKPAGAAALPRASVALQATGVVPSAKLLPDAGTHVALPAPSTASDVGALKVAVAPLGPVASTPTEPGTVITVSYTHLTLPTSDLV